MKKEYISPKVIAREVKLDNLMLVLSNGTEADPTAEVEAKHGSFEDDDEEFDY